MRAVLVMLALALLATARAEVSADRAAALEHLLRHDCGSCHGFNLDGGLGPDLRRDRMQGMSAASIAAIIRDGVPGTAMPAWRALLDADDVDYLVAVLRGGR